MKKILLVDNDQDILEMVDNLLTAHGFKVQTHSTGLNVSEVVNTCKPNLILLNTDLPGKSGMEICKELKQSLSIPIILSSGYSYHKKAIVESDADGFIRKPFETNHLINTISSHLNLVLTVF